MRIGFWLYAHDEQISGVEYYAIGLINAMAQFSGQHECLVLTNRVETFRKYIRNESVKFIRLPMSNSRVGRVVWGHLCLSQFAKKHGVDVLIGTNYFAPALNSAVPCIVVIHDCLALDHPSWCSRWNAIHARLLLGHSIRTAVCTVAVSKATAVSINGRFANQARRFEVIYPGVDSLFEQPLSDRDVEAARRHYGLPDQFLLYVGNIEPKKNVAGILNALDRLHGRGITMPLVLMGGRSWRSSQVRSRIEYEIVAGGAIRLGYVSREDQPYIYKMADALVCASLHEGFGFPPLEAMAVGTPVVASSCGALAETAAPAAQVIDPHDPIDMADGIERVVSDPAIRKRLVSRGKEHMAKFDWSRCAEQFHELCENVVG